MRRLVVVGAVAVAVAWAAIASPAGGEEEGAAAATADAAAPAWVTVRLIRTPAPADLQLDAGETRILGEDGDELLRRLRDVDGPEAVATRRVETGRSDDPLLVSLLDRVPYVSGYDVERGLGERPIGKPIRESAFEGVTVELDSRLDADGPTVEIEVQARIGALGRPIATFPTESCGPPLIIELPEVTEHTAKFRIRVPVGSRGVLGLDLHSLLLVEASPERPGTVFVPAHIHRR